MKILKQKNSKKHVGLIVQAVMLPDDLSKKEINFLLESNKIEDVFDDQSLEDAKSAWIFLRAQPVLTIPVILQTHKILMQNQPLQKHEIGFFRQRPVWIGNREGVKSLLIEEKIKEWLEDVSTSIKIPGKNGIHIKLDHITYEKCHPFLDGNGRSGRLFMAWERLQAGLPILVIKASERQKYYKWFKEVKDDPAIFDVLRSTI